MIAFLVENLHPSYISLCASVWMSDYLLIQSNLSAGKESKKRERNQAWSDLYCHSSLSTKTETFSSFGEPNETERCLSVCCVCSIFKIELLSWRQTFTSASISSSFWAREEKKISLLFLGSKVEVYISGGWRKNLQSLFDAQWRNFPVGRSFRFRYYLCVASLSLSLSLDMSWG